MQRTRVGIVGMGMIGRAHLDALRRIQDIEVVAVVERDGQSAKAAAERFAIGEWYDSVDSMLASSVDVVHNCTPNAMHDAVNGAVIGAGKHLYAEKPLSDTAATAFSMYRKAEQAGIVHAVNHQYRMNPAVQEMRVRIARGEMGRSFLVHGRYHQQSGLYETDYGWRMTEGGMSCGLSDIGTHWVDTARCVLGKNIQRVYASVSTIHPIRTKPSGERIAVETDDLSAVLLWFEDGTQGVLTVSKVSAGHMNDLMLSVDGQNMSFDWAQEDPNRLRIGYKDRPDALLHVSPQTVDPAIRDLALLPGGHPLGWNDALYLSLVDFYRVLRGEIAQSSMRCATFLDGAHGCAFVEAAVKSSRECRPVEVDYGALKNGQ